MERLILANAWLSDPGCPVAGDSGTEAMRFAVRPDGAACRHRTMALRQRDRRRRHAAVTVGRIDLRYPGTGGLAVIGTNGCRCPRSGGPGRRGARSAQPIRGKD